MKKLFSVLAVLFVLGTTTVFAKGSTGIGAQAGWPLGGALTFKVSKLPCVFAADIGLGSVTHVGVTADWWIANPKISGAWGYYYGVGVYGGVGIGGDNVTIGVGPRALIGTNVFIMDGFLEFYLQAAWQPTLWINSGAGFGWLNFPVNAGFRFWF